MSETKKASKDTLTVFGQILTRNNSEISKQRATRWAHRLVKSSELVVNRKEVARDNILEELENMLDISTSNDLQTANRKGDFQADVYAEKIHDLEYKLAIANEELDVAKETHAKYCAPATEE